MKLKRSDGAEWACGESIGGPPENIASGPRTPGGLLIDPQIVIRGLVAGEEIAHGDVMDYRMTQDDGDLVLGFAARCEVRRGVPVFVLQGRIRRPERAGAMP